MNGQIKKIKIIDSIAEVQIDKIENSVKEISGVVDVSFDVENNILNYAIDMWASDYDVMVIIINLLSDNFNLESEPFFDDEEESKEDEEDIIYAPTKEEIEESESESEGFEELSETELKRKEVKYKFIEVGISLICIIIGAILSNIGKARDAVPYLYTAAFSVVSYEFIFDTIAKIFKKQFNFTNIALLLSILFSIILGMPLGSAVLMTAYSVANILFELYKLNASEKYDFNFDVKFSKTTNKNSGIFYGIVLAVCLIVTFVSPLFFESYSDNLLNCAKNACAILMIFAITPSLFYLPICYFLTYKFALKHNVLINNEKAFENVARAKQVAFLGQNVFVQGDNLKENALGSVLELYDAGILDTVLLSSKQKDVTSKLRKELAIKSSVSNLDDQAKNNEILAMKQEAKKSTVLAVGNIQTEADATITLEDGDFDVVIKDSNLKKIPFIVKLLKRCRSIIIQNLIFTFIVKLIISTLCGFGIITNLVVAISIIILVGLLTFANSLRACLEVI